MKEIVICATQRCGSTMVIEDMRNTGVLGLPEEWFVPWDSQAEGKDWEQALVSVRKRASGETGVMAIKVMANQLQSVDACMSTFKEIDSKKVAFPNFADEFANATFIKLTRRDVVGQAISRVISRQTGINHATKNAEDQHFAGNLQKGYKSDYNQNIVYRYGVILREVSSIVLENLAWERFFQINDIEYTEMYYEDIAADPKMGHLDVIAEKAGVEGPLNKTERKLVKLANERNEQWRNRFFRDAALKDYRARHN